jgi:hypothetical protein
MNLWHFGLITPGNRWATPEDHTSSRALDYGYGSRVPRPYGAQHTHQMEGGGTSGLPTTDGFLDLSSSIGLLHRAERDSAGMPYFLESDNFRWAPDGTCYLFHEWVDYCGGDILLAIDLWDEADTSPNAAAYDSATASSDSPSYTPSVDSEIGASVSVCAERAPFGDPDHDLDPADFGFSDFGFEPDVDDGHPPTRAGSSGAGCSSDPLPLPPPPPPLPSPPSPPPPPPTSPPSPPLPPPSCSPPPRSSCA